MTPTQRGYFILGAALMVVAALLAGDLITLYRSGGSMDKAFGLGMVMHLIPVLAAYKAGKDTPSPAPTTEEAHV